MSISIHNCTDIGKVVMVLWGMAFFAFVFSTIVLGNNQREDYEPESRRQKIIQALLGFYFPRSAIKERVISWYKPYVTSFFMLIPLSVVFFGAVANGYLCVPS